MVSKSKKANAKAFRRSRNKRNKRNKRSKMNKRTTRRRKGGECGDITTHGDNYHCVQAGCDPYECADHYTASIPHKPDDDDEKRDLAAEMKTLTLKQYARDNRRTARRTRRASTQAQAEAASYSSPINQYEQKLFNTFVSYLDKELKELIKNDPDYKYLSTTPIENLMTHDRLATSFEAYCFDKLLPPDAKRTSPKMREASVKQYKLLMPRLLENYNASVVGHRRD
jgi:hypothetical protein